MNTMTTLKWCKCAFIAAALVSAPLATAGPSPDSHEMKTAIAKAAQGPDHLRRYIWRTLNFYALNYNEVMAQFKAAQAAGADGTTQVAQTGMR
jgi:hypothetical protein